MTSFPSPSKPAKLSDALHQHLHMYALAASATGVSILALAQPSEAEIIYTPANIMIGANQRYDLDVTGDGTIDFTIRDHTIDTTSKARGSIFVGGKPGNAVAGHIVAYGPPWAYALQSGARVTKQARHFVGGGRASMIWTSFVSQYSRRAGGSWFSYAPYSTHFLGLKFKINGQVHYGWARLTIATYPTLNATLTGYAYETIANKPIVAGQEQGTDEAMEQRDPAALTKPRQAAPYLGLLAKGAPALCVWRRPEDKSPTCYRK